MTEQAPQKKVKKRFVRKRARIFNLIEKIKLWPSRTGQLHGIRTIEVLGHAGGKSGPMAGSQTARLTTHCGKEFIISNSLNSRAARWLRNKWFIRVCPQCGVPEWKLEKFASTRFKRHQGSLLENNQGSLRENRSE